MSNEICNCGSENCPICNPRTLPEDHPLIVWYKKLGEPVPCEKCGGYNPPGRECGWCKQRILPGFEKVFQKPEK